MMDALKKVLVHLQKKQYWICWRECEKMIKLEQTYYR